MICTIGNHQQNNNMEYRHKSVLFFLVPEGSGIFKTYTLILPGIKKDRMAAVGT